MHSVVRDDASAAPAGQPSHTRHDARHDARHVNARRPRARTAPDRPSRRRVQTSGGVGTKSERAASPGPCVLHSASGAVQRLRIEAQKRRRPPGASRTDGRTHTPSLHAFRFRLPLFRRLCGFRHRPAPARRSRHRHTSAHAGRPLRRLAVQLLARQESILAATASRNCIERFNGRRQGGLLSLMREERLQRRHDTT